MEPVSSAPGEGTSYAIAERADEPASGSGLSDQIPEPFVATIVRLDQSTAEELFRLATR